jgi:predicted dienelactone hydrolase
MRFAVSLLLGFFCTTVLAQARSGFAGLEPGPHGVGLRIVQQYDYTRSYREKIDLVTGTPNSGNRARPMQTLVWYPTREAGKSMIYGDYVRAEATDEVFEQPRERITAFMAHQLEDLAVRRGMPQARRLLDQPMWAVRDAAPAPGIFPVVIYSAGVGGAAHESADLFEYLASHGYVVIATRNMGTRTREMNIDWDGVDTQVRDLQFLISYARTLPQANMAHIAAVGWSWGGMTNVFAAARDSRITALVSLDGTREPEFTKTIPRAHVTLPWLYISSRPDTIAILNKRGIETSFSLLNNLHYANVYEVTMQPMTHLDFSSAALRRADPRHFDDYSREEVETAYRWMSRYVLEFFAPASHFWTPHRQNTASPRTASTSSILPQQESRSVARNSPPS